MDGSDEAKVPGSLARTWRLPGVPMMIAMLTITTTSTTITSMAATIVIMISMMIHSVARQWVGRINDPMDDPDRSGRAAA